MIRLKAGQDGAQERKKLLLESPAKETHRRLLPSLANKDCNPGLV
jgi:hypothetical protein